MRKINQKTIYRYMAVVSMLLMTIGINKLFILMALL